VVEEEWEKWSSGDCLIFVFCVTSNLFGSGNYRTSTKALELVHGMVEIF
jgi:hypothetical protein